MASLTCPLISATFTQSREKDLKVKLVAEKSQKKFTKDCDSSMGSLNSLIRGRHFIVIGQNGIWKTLTNRR